MSWLDWYNSLAKPSWTPALGGPGTSAVADLGGDGHALATFHHGDEWGEVSFPKLNRHLCVHKSTGHN